MRNRMVRLLQGFLLSVLAVMYLCLPAEAVTEINGGSVNRYNIMLVIDASGSLSQSRQATDPEGLRYDAIRLLSGLMTNKGNNIGAIVFNQDIVLDTGLQPINNSADKRALVESIQNAKVGGDTNIGAGLLRAVQTLQGKSDENGLQSVVLLLSDGNTDLPKAGEAGRQQSLADQENAIQLAIAENIPIDGIWLNSNNNGKREEMQNITERTGGYLQEVKSAADLTDAFARFYTLINNIEPQELEIRNFDENGRAETDFSVPPFGVEEINVIVKTEKPLDEVVIRRPDGSVIGQDELESMSIITRQYQMIKIPDPMEGSWKLALKGVPNSAVSVSMIYNSSLSLELVFQEKETYGLGEEIDFIALPRDRGKAEGLSKNDLGHFKAELIFTDSYSQEETREEMSISEGVILPMEYKGNRYDFKCSFELKKGIQKEGAFYVQACIQNAGLKISSDTLLVRIENQPPEGAERIQEKVNTGLFQSGKWVKDLNQYFTDPEGERLTFQVEPMETDPEVIELEDDVITVRMGKEKELSFQVKAEDESGKSSTMIVTLESRNLTPFILGVLVALLFVVAVILIRAKKKKDSMYSRLVITVVGIDENGNETQEQSQQSFNGKLQLVRFNPGACGLPLTGCWFEPVGDTLKAKFCSRTPFYYNGRQTKEILLYADTEFEVYSSESQTSGIRIITESPLY